MAKEHPDDEAIVGREREQGRLAGLLNLDGGPQAMVVLGAAGVGKSALLRAVRDDAVRAGRRVLYAAGDRSESDLPFAGLHQVLHPVLDAAHDLGGGTAAVLDAAFSSIAQPEPPQRFAVAMAVLDLLSEVAAGTPLLVVVDDAHWFDRASLAVLGFVARRLVGEPIAVVGAAHGEVPPPGWERGLEVVEVGPLAPQAAQRLLARQPGAPDLHLRERVLAEAAGNPLAVIELAKAAGASFDPASWPEQRLTLSDRLGRLYVSQLAALPRETMWLLLLAALAGNVNVQTLVDAGSGPGGGLRSEFSLEALRPAEQQGLIRVESTGDGARIVFRHPLVRSAVRQAAPFTDRRAAHLALAAVTADPDRRVWHRAAAAVAPDEELADELLATAERALARGATVEALTAMERSAGNTSEPALKAQRLLLAAQHAWLSDLTEHMLHLGGQAATLSDDPAVQASASLVTGWALSNQGRQGAALDILIPLARQLAAAGSANEKWAVTTVGSALVLSGAAEHRRRALRLTAGLPSPADPADVQEVWARILPDPLAHHEEIEAVIAHTARHFDRDPVRLMLAGTLALFTDRTDQALRLVADPPAWAVGGGTPRPIGNVVQYHACAYLDAGLWDQAQEAADLAADLAAELDRGMGLALSRVLQGTLAALRGRPVARRLLTAVLEAGYEEVGVLSVRAYRALAMVETDAGDPAAAYEHLRKVFGADGEPVHFLLSPYAVADLAAAAVRTGREDHREHAAAAAKTVAAVVDNGGTPRLRMLSYHARALLAAPPQAEEHFRSALEDPGCERWPFERALVRLDYGRWLRRRFRPLHARPHLVAALEVFERLSAVRWAERARDELRAAGVQRADPAPSTLAELSGQEMRIARLAAQGLSNREIAERMFLSPRTVGAHLYRIFPKLGITSRAQIRDVLDDPGT
ncbi:ATP-binding protein [Streptosporangium carneum]|uniref:Transcriptional regulator n=1 Tax=Streptosporangium carneum TaxID=47481 RepID=A0A9W6MCN9_9ACTN|nr:AAA family ATPase [Streptosporangium carneum]GLK09371.1 transcriptional regulator [Streptosporangium carneum]